MSIVAMEGCSQGSSNLKFHVQLNNHTGKAEYSINIYIDAWAENINLIFLRILAKDIS